MSIEPFTERYQRQIQFVGFGREGQERLAGARVLICGCGALGSMVANHLVRAGVGHVRIVDRDLVDVSNLHRQCLFDEADALQQLPKAVAAAEKLSRINSGVVVEPVVADLRADNLERFAGDVHLILDGTDNFETRFLINDFAVKEKIPWIFSACLGAQGQVMVVLPGQGPCLRCLIPELPAGGAVPTCETAGILGPVVGVVASLEAMEALKLLAGRSEVVTRDLLVINLWPIRIRQIALAELSQTGCPTCKGGVLEFLNRRYTSEVVTLCGRKTVQITPARGLSNLDELATRWANLGSVERNPFFVRLRLPDCSLTVFPDGRALVSGTEDPAVAKTLYSRYVGM